MGNDIVALFTYQPNMNFDFLQTTSHYATVLTKLHNTVHT